MFGKWLRFVLWQPFALMCRRFPLWPFRATITQPVEHVVCIRIDNLLTRLLSRFSGGYDYAVCYLKLQAEWMFDAHGSIFAGVEVVETQLQRKLDFLTAIRERVHQYATHRKTIQHLTRRVFDRRDLVNWLYFGDGWLSLITGSDFSRGNIVKSFLRESSQ